MTTAGNSRWQNAPKPHRIESAARAVAEEGFWAFVDSQAAAASHVTDEHYGCDRVVHDWVGTRVNCSDWTHVRGEACMAASSRLTQCAMPPIDGLPFCGFHLDRAWLAMCAFFEGDLLAAHRESQEFDRSMYGIEAARLRDAKATLARQGERVYFYRVDDAVKVGRSVNPKARVRSLKGTLAPDGIDVRSGALLGTILGGCAVEGELHDRFRRHRLVGEWFAYEPIASQISGLIAAGESEAVA